MVHEEDLIKTNILHFITHPDHCFTLELNSNELDENLWNQKLSDMKNTLGNINKKKFLYIFLKERKKQDFIALYIGIVHKNRGSIITRVKQHLDKLSKFKQHILDSEQNKYERWYQKFYGTDSSCHVKLLLYQWDNPRNLGDQLLFGLTMSVENAEAILVAYCDIFFRDALVNQTYASKINEFYPGVRYHYDTDIHMIDIYGENILSFWESWTNWYIDLTKPISLFETEENSNIVKIWKNTKGNSILQINPLMENTVIQAVKTVEDSYNARTNGFNGVYYDGLIYMVYLRRSEMRVEYYNGTFVSEIIPIYIGKTETLGRSKNFSTNLLGVSKGNNKQYFARWGYDEARHIGGLSYCFFGIKNKYPSTDYEHWIKYMFDEEARQKKKLPILKLPVYFQIKPWNPEGMSVQKMSNITTPLMESILIAIGRELFPNFFTNKLGR